MPALALIGLRGRAWLPPLPLPLFLLWPLVPVALGVARVLDRKRPDEAAQVRAVILLFHALRGLRIDVDTRDEHVKIRVL
jgi:hypothetical protein